RLGGFVFGFFLGFDGIAAECTGYIHAVEALLGNLRLMLVLFHNGSWRQVGRRFSSVMLYRLCFLCMDVILVSFQIVEARRDGAGRCFILQETVLPRLICNRLLCYR